MNWIEHLSFYKWVVIGGASLAVFLSVMGTQLATRGEAMKTMLLAQAAMLGALLGMKWSHSDFSHGEGSYVLPIFTSIIVALLVAWVAGRLAARSHFSKSAFYLSGYFLLMCVSQILTALTPSLESHMTQMYFGDLGTLSDNAAFFCFALGIVGSILFLLSWRPIARRSFQLASYASEVNRGAAGSFLATRIFEGLALLAIVFSVLWVGIVFTLTVLFIPTLCLTLVASQSALRTHLGACALVACTSTVLGFLFSLQVTALPTVPTIAVVMLLLGVATGIILRITNER